MPSADYRRGEIAALRRVRKWLCECRDRNLDFQIKFPDAPNWQLLSAKYGALTQDAHIHGIDAMIAKARKVK